MQVQLISVARNMLEVQQAVTKCKVAAVHEPDEQWANSATPGICSAFCSGRLCYFCHVRISQYLHLSIASARLRPMLIALGCRLWRLSIITL